MTDTSYGFGTTTDSSFEDAVARVTEGLAAEGFGVLTEIDVQATLKKKLGAEFRRYVILGACNPTLAKQALEADPQIGLLLPCNVVVQETEGGQIAISIADPEAMFKLAGHADIGPVAASAKERLRRVIDSL